MSVLFFKKSTLILLAILVFGFGTKNSFAEDPQTSQSSLYVPLIGITAVPDPLALPQGAGNVTYNYAVKNFLQEISVTNVRVVDDKCSPVKFTEGDDNDNSRLDYSETWRYTCTTQISETTQSIATANATANDINATHKAYTTVVVGLNDPPPLVSIVNITKVAYPLALPKEGGSITFTYKVNNPGVIPLNNVTVTDNKCFAMSNKLGDRNGNNLLDTNEVWIYTCTMPLKETTTNTATVTAFSDGFQATSDTSITVKVETPSLPETGQAITNLNIKIAVWSVLFGVLAGLITFFVLTRMIKIGKKR